jgi:AcrR family transcriptional regulator
MVRFHSPYAAPMSGQPLPLVRVPRPERSDAARNRGALLVAARRMVEQHGVEALTMDALAREAGVGKGTVFRRFANRAGLMAALLNHSETDFQTRVMTGPAPLGPGAPAWERLQAFGRTRLEYNLQAARLIEAAGRTGRRSFAAESFAHLHVVHLLRELGVRGDLPFLATALLAPLEAVVVEEAVRLEGFPVDRFVAGWEDLGRRVVEG